MKNERVFLITNLLFLPGMMMKLVPCLVVHLLYIKKTAMHLLTVTVLLRTIKNGSMRMLHQRGGSLSLKVMHTENCPI